MIVDIAFVTLAALALFGGLQVFRVDSMVRASFWLMLSFIAVGGIALLLAAPYIGVATVFMMAVEMMVMAVFMVMFMMNPAGLNPMMMVHQHRVSIAAGALAFAGLVGAVLLTDLPSDPVPPDTDTIHALGIELLNNSMLVFETAGVTLLAAMVAAIVLSSRSGRYGDATAGAVPPGLTAGGSPAGRVPDEGGGHHAHHGHAGHHDHAGHNGGGNGGHEHHHGGKA